MHILNYNSRWWTAQWKSLPIYIITSLWGYMLPHSVSILDFVDLFFLNLYPSNRWKHYLIFICITWILPEVKTLFRYWLAYCIFLFSLFLCYFLITRLSVVILSIGQILTLFHSFSTCHLSFNLSYYGLFAVQKCKFLFFFFFFCFPEPHPWHMEAPRLGVETELELLAYTTVGLQPHWILNPLNLCPRGYYSGSFPLNHDRNSQNFKFLCDQTKEWCFYVPGLWNPKL